MQQVIMSQLMTGDSVENEVQQVIMSQLMTGDSVGELKFKLNYSISDCNKTKSDINLI